MVRKQRDNGNEITDEIRNETAVGKPAGGVVEESEAIWREIGLKLGSGVDVIVVSSIQN